MSNIINIIDLAFEEGPTITGPVRHGYRRRSKQALTGAQRTSNARFECLDWQTAVRHCLLSVNGNLGPGTLAKERRQVWDAVLQPRQE